MGGLRSLELAEIGEVGEVGSLARLARLAEIGEVGSLASRRANWLQGLTSGHGRPLRPFSHRNHALGQRLHGACGLAAGAG